jgi:hypothetical protein
MGTRMRSNAPRAADTVRRRLPGIAVLGDDRGREGVLPVGSNRMEIEKHET